jgi:serine/threonine protein kinase
VVDFGIAHHLDATAVTATRMTTGTPGWMAPEQLERATTTTASDLFAWGLLTAYAATGWHPFGAPIGIEYRIVAAEPELGGVPAQLADLVVAALAKDPAARPPAAELASRAAALNGPAGAAAFPTLTDARTALLPALPATLWAPPTAVSEPAPDISSAPTAVVTAAALAATDPRARLLAALEEIETLREESIRTSERLARSLTARDSGYAEATALKFFIGMHMPTAHLAALCLSGDNDVQSAHFLHKLLQNDPQKAAEAITYFRGPGASVLEQTGYQGNALDLAHRLITITQDALPVIADHIARHDPDFPELPDALRRTWQNATNAARRSTAALRQPATPPPRPTVGRRRMLWWRA